MSRTTRSMPWKRSAWRRSEPGHARARRHARSSASVPFLALFLSGPTCFPQSLTATQDMLEVNVAELTNVKEKARQEIDKAQTRTAVLEKRTKELEVEVTQTKVEWEEMKEELGETIKREEATTQKIEQMEKPIEVRFRHPTPPLCLCKHCYIYLSVRCESVCTFSCLLRYYSKPARRSSGCTRK